MTGGTPFKTYTIPNTAGGNNITKVHKSLDRAGFQ
jgi:hypothetical protein